MKFKCKKISKWNFTNNFFSTKDQYFNRGLYSSRLTFLGLRSSRIPICKKDINFSQKNLLQKNSRKSFMLNVCVKLILLAKWFIGVQKDHWKKTLEWYFRENFLRAMEINYNKLLELFWSGRSFQNRMAEFWRKVS